MIVKPNIHIHHIICAATAQLLFFGILSFLDKILLRGSKFGKIATRSENCSNCRLHRENKKYDCTFVSPAYLSDCS